MANEKQNNSQRVQSLQLLPKQVNTIYFNDTKPNHIHVNSYDSGNLYFTMKGTPSPKRYDMLIPSQSDNIWAQQVGVTRCYIYNDSAAAVSVVITSFEETFRPEILAKSTVNVSGAGGIASTVTIGAHTAPLPAGANNIGKVEVTKMPAQTFSLETLPAGSNNIGKVDINTMPPLPAGESTIGKVGIVGAVTIDSMPAVTVSSQPTSKTHKHFESNVGATNVSYTFDNPVNMINHLSNDGDSDILVNFDERAIGNMNPSTSNGTNGTFRLKAGEALTNFSRTFTTINVLRPTGSGLVRFLGV